MRLLDVPRASQRPHGAPRRRPTACRPAPRGWAVFFGDLKANAYAVDATTGRSDLDPQDGRASVRRHHRRADLLRRPCLRAGRRASTRKCRADGRSTECCTFRGSVSRARRQHRHGRLEDLHRRRAASRAARTPAGMQQWGPAGGGIWSAPTIDVRRGAVYVGTGNGYADPAQPMTDAVVALDIKSGKVRWFHQLTPDDTWTLGCRAKNPDNPNCPDDARSRLRLLGVAGAGQGRRARSAGAAAEIGHGLRARSRQAGRDRVAVPHSARAAAAAASGAAPTDGRQAYFGVNGSGAGGRRHRRRRSRDRRARLAARRRSRRCAARPAATATPRRAPR